MQTTAERPWKVEGGIDEAGRHDDAHKGTFERGLALRLPAISLEQAIWIGLIIVAFALRIWDVGSRAMHHDESMHAYYGWKLFLGDGYQYNPLLHGPFQFHAIALMDLLFGVSDASARLTAVLCGTGIVIGTWFLRPFLGRFGALIAGFLFALSPAFLYFSRFTREDIYVAFFTLLMVAGMFGWLHARRNGYIYLLFTATALAFATKESTFITLFIFGTFLILVLIWEMGIAGRLDLAHSGRGPFSDEGLHPDSGGRPVTESLFAISGRAWTIGIICSAAVIVLLFTTFFSNRHGLADAFVSSLQYWLGQQAVKRGNQPAYYYALLLPAYEQIPLLFGVIGMWYFVFKRWFVPFAAVAFAGAHALAITDGSRVILLALAGVLLVWTTVAGLSRRALFPTFLTYWALLAFIIYTWAGEKMPWLVLHIDMPLVLLAGLFLGHMLKQLPAKKFAVGSSQGELTVHVPAFWTTAVVAGLLVVYMLHVDWPLNYYRGDVPKDLLIYTQTSPQVKDAVAQINQLSNQLTGGTDLNILIDNSSTWPFAWYLRDYKNLSYQATIASAPQQPVVITAVENDQQDKAQLSNYVGNRYKLRAWFPEEYRDLTLQKAIQDVRDPAKRKALWSWVMLREPPAPLGSYDFNLWIRKDLAPGLISNFGFVQQATTAGVVVGPDPFANQTARLASLRQFGASGTGDGQLSGPRGVAVAADGSVYVADQANNRVEKFGANGGFLAKWGSKGSSDGQFDSLSGIATDKAGNVWVADLWNHRVQEFDANGKFLLKFGSYAAASGATSPGAFFGPRGIAVGPDGSVYVTDTGNKRVQKFSSSGQFQAVWGQGGNGPGQLEEPIGIAVDQQGSVYVADTWNRRIQKFGSTGNFISEISVGSWPGAQTTVGEPFLAVEPNGMVLASDPLRSRVLAFSPDGQLQSAWGGPGNDTSSLSAPTGVSITPNGEVVVSDTSNDRILVFPAPK